MDRNLLYKDWLMVRRRVCILAPLAMVIFTVFEMQARDSIFRWMPLPMLACMFMYMVVGMVYEKDDRNDAPMLLISAAYSRRNIMLNRYIFISGLGFGFLLLCLAIKLAIYRFDFGEMVTAWGLGMVVSAAIVAVAVPFLAKYSYVKAQNTMMIIYFLLVVLFVLGVRYGSGFTELLLGANDLKSPGMFLLVTDGAAIAALAASCRICLRVYDQREFF